MNNLIRWLKGRGEYGQTLAEFALLLPLIALIIFGLVDMARVMQSYVTLQEAARDGTRYAVTGRIDCTGVSTQTRENCIVQQVKDRLVGLNNANSMTTVYRSWSYPAYANPATENNAGSQCDAVEIEVTYQYIPITPIFRSLISNNITLKAKERLVNEPFGTCA